MEFPPWQLPSMSISISGPVEICCRKSSFSLLLFILSFYWQAKKLWLVAVFRFRFCFNRPSFPEIIPRRDWSPKAWILLKQAFSTDWMDALPVAEPTGSTHWMGNPPACSSQINAIFAVGESRANSPIWYVIKPLSRTPLSALSAVVHSVIFDSFYNSPSAKKLIHSIRQSTYQSLDLHCET